MDTGFYIMATLDWNGLIIDKKEFCLFPIGFIIVVIYGDWFWGSLIFAILIFLQINFLEFHDFLANLQNLPYSSIYKNNSWPNFVQVIT